jgi:hypothetical protein
MQLKAPDASLARFLAAVHGEAAPSAEPSIPPPVGFAGWAGSGKDTAAQAAAGYGRAYVHAFAATLKRAIEAFNPDVMVSTGAESVVRINELLTECGGWDGLKETCGRNYRFILERFGTELRRLFGDRVFASTAEHVMQHVAPTPTVFSDVRFPEELELIRRYRGVVFWVDRPGIEKLALPSANAISAGDCDYIINNVYSTVGDFQTAVQNIVEIAMRGKWDIETD